MYESGGLNDSFTAVIDCETLKVAYTLEGRLFLNLLHKVTLNLIENVPCDVFIVSLYCVYKCMSS